MLKDADRFQVTFSRAQSRDRQLFGLEGHLKSSGGLLRLGEEGGAHLTSTGFSFYIYFVFQVKSAKSVPNHIY